MLFLRAAPLVVLALTVIYVSLFLYFRAIYRDRLTAGAMRMEPALLDARVQAYATRLRRRLAWIVYGIPVAVVAVIIILDSN